MSRTKLADRILPNYTKGEEIFNMVSHLVGAAFGVYVLVACIIGSVQCRNWWGLGSGIFYGTMMIFLYCMSATYHGLNPGMGKKVMQVLDHCSIYALIIGTEAPILCGWLRQKNLVLFIVCSSLLLVATAVGVTFTAIDHKKYAVISYASYFTIGWVFIFGLYSMYKFYGLAFVLWLVIGGAIYTLGMIFYGIGVKKKYMHSIFHLFILGGSVLQFIAVYKWCILTTF